MLASRVFILLYLIIVTIFNGLVHENGALLIAGLLSMLLLARVDRIFDS